MTLHQLTSWGCSTYNRFIGFRLMTIQQQAMVSGYLLVDGGKISQSLNGFRYTLIRNEDKSVYRYATAKQVRDQIKG